MKANALPVAVVSLAFALSAACGRQSEQPTGAETGAGLAILRARSGPAVPARTVHIRAADGTFLADSAGAHELASARVVLPGRANGKIHLEDRATGTSIDIALVGAKNSVGQVVDGYVVYPKGHAWGSIYQRAELSGVEDYLAFDERPASPSIAYDVALGPKVAGLRLVENQLEMLDGSGVPRLRVAPPYVVGADGALTDALLAVEGCAVDTDPAGPWGRTATPTGARRCRVRVSWVDDAVVYPAVLDPRWQTTGSMSVARQDHNLIYLPLTGKVLAVGGRSSPTSTTGLASAELFDKSSGTWSATASMSGGRWSASATLLGPSSNGTTSQKVLIAGGMNGTASVNTARLYNQAAGTWATAGTLNAPRHLHTATRLNDGRVLVCGGMNGSTILTSAALYNPASGSGSWVATIGPIPPPGWRSGTATLIQTSNGQLNNKVLLAGGNNGSSTISAVFLFDPAQSAFSTLAAMPNAREGHRAVALNDGRILFSGGKNGSTYLASSVIFDPSWGPGSWTSAGNMTSPRWGHAMDVLPTAVLHLGLVLVSGGSNGTTTLSSTEYWNGTNWATDGAMVAPVQKHVSVGLGNSILIAGGAINNGSTTVSAAEVYDPSIGLGCTSNSQCASGFCVSGVCCDSACNGGCGSCNLAGHLGVCTPLTSGSVCRALAEICDVAETCDGASLACPGDALQPSATECRASAGACDVAESCTGTGVACPADAFQPPATVCRPAVSDCDVTESCGGDSAACPTDDLQPDETTCDDGNLCTQTDTCQSGACTGSAPLSCEPLDGCHDSGVCDEQTGTCSNPTNWNGPACVLTDDWSPSTPLVLQATATSSGSVSLTWNDVEGEGGYFVIRSTDGGSQFVEAAELSAGATAWEDPPRQALATYCYKVRAVSAAGHASSNLACVQTPIVFEAEEQTRNSSDGPLSVVNDEVASNGQYVSADLSSIGSWVEYLLNVPVTGTFRVKVRMPTGQDRARWRLWIDGIEASLETDTYAAGSGSQVFDLGEVRIDSVEQPKHFRFEVTGRSEQSTGHVVAVDAFTLFRAGNRYEAEESNPVASEGDTETNAPDSAASAGQVASGALDAADDHLRFTLPVAMAGKYSLLLRYRTGPDQGTFRALLDDTEEIGAVIDGYSETTAYVARMLDTIDIGTSGPHAVTLKVTGKSGGSTGYGITADYFELTRDLVNVVESFGNEPVILEATFGCQTNPDPQTQPGTADTAEPVTFSIPNQVSVVTGNAANQQATLLFRNGAADPVTCTYRGGASTEHPTNRLEYIKGSRYLFQACSDGSLPRASASATHFELSLLGADCQPTTAATKARILLGGSQCADGLTESLSPDETYVLRSQFSWDATAAVPERNAEGKPTLWYAMIYLHDPRQPGALDSLLVHHQKAPIFVTPGQDVSLGCGSFASVGDGEGRFEYALLPGVVFNKLRTLAIAAGPDIGPRALFKAIKILTPPLSAAANADGSVAIDFLNSLPFRYMGYLSGQAVTHPDGTSHVIQRSFSLNPVDWAEELWEAGKDLVEETLGWLGQATLAVFPRTYVFVKLIPTSKEPLFAGRLTQGWGKDGGKDLGVPGVRVNLWYAPLGVVMPFGGTTDEKGRVTIEVPKYSRFVAEEIIVENDAAEISWNGMLTEFMLSHRSELEWLVRNTDHEVHDSGDLSILAQFSDARNYFKTVVGYEPQKAKIAKGSGANYLASFNNHNPVTTCATFPNLLFDNVKFSAWMIGSVLPTVAPDPATGLSLALATMPVVESLDSDMWLDDTKSEVYNSRGIWTHEYGHYAMCSMIYDHGSIEALATLTHVAVSTIMAGEEIDPEDETRILNEAFADFVSAQVVGGVSYYWDPPGTLYGGHMYYCDNHPCDPGVTSCENALCLERNRFETATGRQVIARDITILMDAFDGVDAWHSPNAGDSWVLDSSNPGKLRYAKLAIPGGLEPSEKYANSCAGGGCDEYVHLPGQDIRSVINNWLDYDFTLNHSGFLHGVATTAYERGYTWCDLCRLFGSHTPGNDMQPAPLPQVDGGAPDFAQIPLAQYSEACLTGPIANWIGPFPDPSVTSLERVLNPWSGVCEVCLAGAVAEGDHCRCGPHQRTDGVNCAPCGEGQIALTAPEGFRYCKGCGNGEPIPGEDRCECRVGSSELPDGTCTSDCPPHSVWIGEQCFDCACNQGACYPSPDQSNCFACQAWAPYCLPSGDDGKCYGTCVADCIANCFSPPAPDSKVCGPWMPGGPGCPL